MSASPDVKSASGGRSSGLHRSLRWARIRHGVRLLLEHAAMTLAIVGAAGVIAIAAERTFAVDLINLWTAVGVAVVGVLAVGAAWWLTMPDRMAVAVMVDKRLGLRERVSTALALADSEDPFARAALAEAHDKVRGIQVRRKFPIKFSRRWAYAAGAWVAVAAMFIFLPGDMLGIQGRRDEQARKQAARAEEKTEAEGEVRQVAKVIRMAVSPIADEKLAGDLDSLDKLSDGAPEVDNVKRDAIRKLGDLSDELKKRLASEKLTAAAAMKQMLKGIRGTSDAMTRKLSAALAKGDFAAAKKALEDIRKELAEGKLSPAQREALAQALSELGKQASEASDPKKQAEKMLESEGLDKKLAGMSPEEMKKALKESGMSEEQIQELMDKLAAIRQGSQSCQGLAEELAEAGEAMGGMTPEELGDLIDQLEEMAGIDGELGQCKLALDEIERAIARLGQGGAEGEGYGEGGGMGEWAAGEIEGGGQGTGGPGRGYGQRGEDDSDLTSLQKVRTNTKTGKGAIIASTYFKGPQVKGESKKDFATVIQAGRDHAAEAIKENNIPLRVAAVVKRYYDEFNKASGGGESSE